MIVLSHRGYWKSAAEKNQPVAFHRSFDLGFGTETDVRDRAGELVISHDMPDAATMTLADFLDIIGQRPVPLALNIKADGIAENLARSMSDFDRASWFVFDMSIPDMRMHLRCGNPVYARLSEVESITGWVDDSEGVWLDAFEDDQWYSIGMIEDLLARGKRVCIVSPELHGRSHRATWANLQSLRLHQNLMLCTDLPEEAEAAFGLNRRADAI
ncbi:phosphodiesterase [Paraburkholderia caballeronis]|uniref:Phosphodiesterase n=1 Tax=Paraburkholderia caballeronis TaxID=416943 RepID=A0A1H7H8B9_9BURK|nr:phosphodiesterase [Paraburkholderia caballeronis]PXW29606.1 hypothetical protein C7403_101462 [Paraburkholderia caballeronis]PXX04865.1 hypothetical protein C7407_101462 [Paraburkholderia caballeronis]RAK05926.1 hypothetical protein C7409_101462 [Paraburkholderia caballeronis]TDV11122.1 hypothetical protein C7408_113135 [Paraburkholderia caballeronis]TDV14188.1 hypothetical protein C7406_11423 [Paraburkholderia caballeronis]